MLLTVIEVCERTRLGRTSIYDEIQSGRLRSALVKGRRLIRSEDLDAWVRERFEDQSALS